MHPGVLEEVADDPLEAQLVDADRVVGGRVDDDGYVGVAVAGGDAWQHLAEADLVAVHVGDADVEARQLEQVEHELVEAVHLVDDDVERLLAAFGEVGPAGVEHLDRGGEGGDRRAQLVADVGGEPGLAFDAGLHGVGHVVERVGEAVEVGVGLGLEPRVEPAGGDLAGGVGDVAQRPHQRPLIQ